MNIETCKKCKFYTNPYINFDCFSSRKNMLSCVRKCENQVHAMRQIFKYPKMVKKLREYQKLDDNKFFALYSMDMNAFPYVDYERYADLEKIEKELELFIKNKLFFKECPYYMEHIIDNWNGEK
jgi:hypothetical protein